MLDESGLGLLFFLRTLYGKNCRLRNFTIIHITYRFTHVHINDAQTCTVPGFEKRIASGRP